MAAPTVLVRNYQILLRLPCAIPTVGYNNESTGELTKPTSSFRDAELIGDTGQEFPAILYLLRGTFSSI